MHEHAKKHAKINNTLIHDKSQPVHSEHVVRVVYWEFF